MKCTKRAKHVPCFARSMRKTPDYFASVTLVIMIP